MSSPNQRRITVHGHVFDVTAGYDPKGREVVRIQGDELQKLMQVNENLELRDAFRDELDRVRRRRAI
jgi:hypothetical protein